MYWTCKKKGKWIYDIDKDGNPVLTNDEKKAHHFKKFDAAMYWFNYGFMIEKCY